MPVMALDRFFCPIKSNKSTRKANLLNHRQHTTNRQVTESAESPPDTTNILRSGHKATNKSHAHLENTPYRYVMQAYEAVQHDELSVKQDDMVLYEFSDYQDGKEWSHVMCLSKNLRGFVPSEILSTEKRFSHKKKLPRFLDDHSPIEQANQPTRTQCTSEQTCPSNGGSMKLQHNSHHVQPHKHHRGHGSQPNWIQQYALSHNMSCQGSSACQTFQKYSEFRQFKLPGYYNLDATTGDGIEIPLPLPYESFSDCHPFRTDNHGLFTVLHCFVGREENDLDVQAGESVTVLNKDDDDWFWVRRYDDNEGFVPARFMVPYKQVQSVLDKGNSTVTMKSSNQNDELHHTYINQGPDKGSPQTDQMASVFPA